jgi:hypothetical protein
VAAERGDDPVQRDVLILPGATAAGPRRHRRWARPRLPAVTLSAPAAPWRLILILVLALAGQTGAGLVTRGAGATLHPDLKTLPPEDLHFDRLEDGTYVLRFSNTIWNAGKGRLELEGDPNAESDDNVVFQNLYDAAVGGERTVHREVATDNIYHPGHEHYHFANLASYALLKKGPGGNYKATTKKGVKVSYCVIDTDDIKGVHDPQYDTCGRELQGLTPGWGDTYGSFLDDQWVVLGAAPLADGQYAVKSQADPKNLLREGGGTRETNNAATTYFTVRDGQIVNVRARP